MRLSLLALVSVVPAWDGVIYVRAAAQLAAGEGYTLRILHEANRALPTAFYPVGFPAVLAAVRLLGGGLWADRLLQIFACTALVPISYLFARRFRSRRAGRAAAWAAALWPGGVFLSATWLAEPVFALGVALSLLPLAYAHRRLRFHALALAALGLGLIAYLRASSLPMGFLLGALLGFSWFARSGSRSPARGVARRTAAALALGAAVVAIACVPLAPWAYRNARLLGAPVLVSTNGGVNLLLGTRGDGGFAPVGADEECKSAPMREIERDRCYSKRALQVIESAPVSWLGRGLLKLVHTFGHESAPAQCFAEGLSGGSAQSREAWKLWALGLSRLGWTLLLAAAMAGATTIYKQGSPIARAILFAPVVALAGLHVLYLGGDRYHPAVAPMVLALAGIAYAELTRRRTGSAATATSASDTNAPDRLDGSSRERLRSTQERA
ncbi:MAG: putative O-linked GlcNAc transferase-putative TPR-containing transrane protein [Myxococcaceae bacterium]|nr:putative O-linked GlcNAc transferase-putative TPR-containing transrane protein [Myxococcaceae bacterium]